MRCELNGLQTTVAECTATIDKEYESINSTQPTDRDRAIARALVLAGDYRFCVMEDSHQALTTLHDTLAGVVYASKRFDSVPSLKALSCKVDQAFDQAAASIKKLHEAIRLRAFDFAHGSHEHDGIVSAADKLYPHKFDVFTANEANAWLGSLSACLAYLQGLSKEYVRRQYIDAAEQIRERVVTP